MGTRGAHFHLPDLSVKFEMACVPRARLSCLLGTHSRSAAALLRFSPVSRWNFLAAASTWSGVESVSNGLQFYQQQHLQRGYAGASGGIPHVELKERLHILKHFKKVNLEEASGKIWGS